jgi:hypothetical protein
LLNSKEGNQIRWHYGFELKPSWVAFWNTFQEAARNMQVYSFCSQEAPPEFQNPSSILFALLKLV